MLEGKKTGFILNQDLKNVESRLLLEAKEFIFENNNTGKNAKSTVKGIFCLLLDSHFPVLKSNIIT